MYKTILDVIRKFISKKLTACHNFFHWLSHELKQLLLSKQLAHRTFKQSSSISDYKKFSDTRLKFKNLFKKYYFTYLTQIQNYFVLIYAHFGKLKKSKKMIYSQ